MPMENKHLDMSPKVDPRRIARKGILELGAYVPGKATEEVKEAYGLEEVVKLASNECPLPLPDGLREVIEAEFVNLARYPDGHCRKLRRRVAAYLGVQEECLLFGNGAEECIRLIGQAFLNPSDAGLIPSPIFDAYETAIRMPGAKVVKVPIKDYQIDLEAMLSAVDRSTKIVWLCSPANPTGKIISRDAFEGFLSLLPENILVVLDEAYREFVADKRAAHAQDYIERDARVIGLRTFSKAFGLAGLRVGYLVAHPSVIEIVSMVKLPFNVNRLAQAAALSMLEEEDFVQNHVEMIQSEREHLRRELEERGAFVVPSEANFLLVKLPLDGDELFKRLLPLGFIIRPGSLWGLNQYIRLTVGTPEQNRRFLSHVDTLLAGSNK